MRCFVQKNGSHVLAAARAPRLGRHAVVCLAKCVGRSVGSAGLRAWVVLSAASCVGREGLHACREFAGIDELFVRKLRICGGIMCALPDKRRA